jgi:hypothetical protein
MDRRQGGSEEQRQVLLEPLMPVRDAVLAHGALSAGDSVLDVGAGDGLIAFGAAGLVGETAASSSAMSPLRCSTIAPGSRWILVSKVVADS